MGTEKGKGANIKLTNDQIELLQSMANIVYDGETKWYNIRFWFKQFNDGEFKIIDPNLLPERIAEINKGNR